MPLRKYSSAGEPQKRLDNWSRSRRPLIIHPLCVGAFESSKHPYDTMYGSPSCTAVKCQTQLMEGCCALSGRLPFVECGTPERHAGYGNSLDRFANSAVSTQPQAGVDTFSVLIDLADKFPMHGRHSEAGFA